MPIADRRSNGKTGMIVRWAAVFGLFWIVAGCGGATNLRPEVGARLRRTRVATLVFMPSKRIDYEELVYKVFWNEERTQTAMFAGLWDIDQDLSAKLAMALERIHLSAVSIPTILNQADVSALSSQVSAASFGDSDNSLKIALDLRGRLREAGIDYLIALDALGFHVTSNALYGDKAIVSVNSTLFVYDIQAGRSEYQDRFHLGGWVSYDKSVRTIELDGLVRLRAATYNWLDSAVNDKMPEISALNEH